MSVPSLAEGIARTIEKHVSQIYHTDVDKIVVAPPPARVGASTPRPIPLNTIDSDLRVAFVEFVSKERNRVAVRKVTSERLRAYRAKMKTLEGAVQEEMRQAGVTKVAVGMDGHGTLEIIPKRGTMDEEEEDGDGDGADGAAATNRALMPSALGVIKLRELVVRATEAAMVELGMNPQDAFAPSAAVQALGHPQLRTLIHSKLKPLIQSALAEKTRVTSSGSGSASKPRPSKVPAAACFDVRFKSAR